MENLVISACLCGICTKYNGKNNLIAMYEYLKDHYNLILICPEVLGGLSTPRAPAEIKEDRVYTKDGVDVTKEFKDGAKKALEIALKNNCRKALLKEGSPSCGVHTVYDGTFSNNKISGIGITAKLFKECGIEIYSEDDIELLMK